MIVRAAPVGGLSLLSDHLQHLQSHGSLVRGDLEQDEKEVFFLTVIRSTFSYIEHNASEMHHVGQKLLLLMKMLLLGQLMDVLRVLQCVWKPDHHYQEARSS